MPHPAIIVAGTIIIGISVGVAVNEFLLRPRREQYTYDFHTQPTQQQRHRHDKEGKDSGDEGEEDTETESEEKLNVQSSFHFQAGLRQRKRGNSGGGIGSSNGVERYDSLHNGQAMEMTTVKYNTPVLFEEKVVDNELPLIHLPISPPHHVIVHEHDDHLAQSGLIEDVQDSSMSSSHPVAASNSSSTSSSSLSSVDRVSTLLDSSNEDLGPVHRPLSRTSVHTLANSNSPVSSSPSPPLPDQVTTTTSVGSSHSSSEDGIVLRYPLSPSTTSGISESVAGEWSDLGDLSLSEAEEEEAEQGWIQANNRATF